MTQIDKIAGIRELTNEEIAVVGGATGFGGGSLSCFFQEIKSIICKVQSFLSCFNFGNNNA